MSLSLSTAEARTIWIDTDPSIGSPVREVDDAFAFLLALNSPELKIAGVSTTYGNASLAMTTRVQRKITHLFGAEDISVSPGAHSTEDLGKTTEATESLRRAVEKHGHLTYVALAPLTNLATFQMRHPDLAAKIDHLIFVGGRSPDFAMRIPPPRGIKIHDANVTKDPAAVRRVLDSSWPITLAPVETSLRITVDKSDLLELARSSDAGRFLYRKTRIWLYFWRYWVRMEGGPLFDALPILLLADSSLVTTETRFAYLADSHLIATKSMSAISPARPVTFCSALSPSIKEGLRERLMLAPHSTSRGSRCQ